MKYIIDPPSDFAPRSEWEEHLKAIRRLLESDPDEPQLQAAEAEALERLEEAP